MKGLIRYLLLVVAAFALLWLWVRAQPENSSSQRIDASPVAGGILPASEAAQRTVEVTPPRTEEIKPPYVVPNSPADLPQVSQAANVYDRARTLAERATPPDEQGRFTKLRLVEAEGKYPFVRIEERWHKDPATGAETLDQSVAMVADHLVVRLQDGATVEGLKAFLAQIGGSIRRQVPNSPVYLVKVPEVSLDAFDLMLRKLREPGAPVAHAEPDYVVHALFTVNDPSFGSLWGLHNTGQTGGVGDADIDAPEAWEVSRGSAAVVIGVIDTGIDYTHPDLAANMWVNVREIPDNGVDDDGNGYVDDTRGWDFVNDDKDPMDDHYHGTHCAGTIGAVGNNGIGVVGVCHTARLMALKFLSASGSGYTSDAVEAVLYATANGATLTSNSWGGGGYSQALKDAIDAARNAGVLFVAAAGNSSVNTDSAPSYPGAYDSANIISVAATDHADKLASFSNYGVNTVDIGAPGVSIYSTSPGAGYRSLSGTSMACPHVAGACALIKAARPEMNWSDVKAAVLENGDGIPALAGKVQSGSRLNIARALLISAGPYITLTNLEVHDDAASGAVGNGDGIINPGEEIVIRVGVKNVGSQPAAGLSSRVSITSGAEPVTMLQDTKNWGALAAGATADNHTSPFRMRVAANAATPYRFTLRLTTTDGAGNSWGSDTELTVFTSSTISGRITALTGGAPISGASVTYDGPSSGAAIVNSEGAYTITVTDGAYTLRALAPGYNPSASVTVNVPPSQTGVDFTLGRSKLQVSPASLASTQLEDQITQHALTVTNTGDSPLTVSIGASSVIASQVSGQSAPDLSALARLGAAEPDERAQVPSVGTLDTAATLPFTDSFESGNFASWNVGGGSGTRSVVGDTAAVGTKSFRFNYTGPTDHFTGIDRSFAPGSKPKSISFWVRSDSTATSSGYFVLTNGGYDLIWFFAKEGGKFYVNEDVGGDHTAPFEANVWYRIEFREIDWAAKCFDYYVNGALVKARIPFRNPFAATGISRLYLYNFSTDSTAWWDDVRVSSESVNWLSSSPGSLSLAAGQSANVSVALNSSGLTAGTYQARLDLYSNDPANPVTIVPVSLNVQLSPNTPPVANSQTVTLLEDTTTGIMLDGSDAENNPLTAVITQLPAAGVLYQTTNGTQLGSPITAAPATVTNADRKVIYVPPADANGSNFATFQFVLKDRRSQSNTATVTLHVTPVNDQPLAYNDVASGLPGEAIPSIAVLANDSDPDGQPLSILSFTQGVRGTVSDNGNGTLRYKPNSGFNQGEDFFTYTVSDGSGGNATATVTVSLGYLAAGPWTTLGNGPAHTGYYPASLSGQSLLENWSLDFGRPLNQVSIAEGKVFVTPDIYFNPTHVSAVDVATGTIAWRKDFAEARSLTGPSYHQGRIYLQRGNHSTDSQLWCVDARDGATVWSAPFSAQWEVYLPPAVTDTSVFVNGGTYGGMYGFKRNTGSQLFFQTLPQEDQWTPTVGGSAVYSCVRGVLISHNPTTGARNWTYNVDTNWYDAKTVAYGSGCVYIAGNSGLYAVNVSGPTPSLAWKVTGSFTGIPAVANGKVFAITGTGSKVQAFYAGSGALIGDYSTPGANCYYQPIVTNDTLIAAATNKVFVFNLSTRALLQTINYGGIVSLSNGALMIAGSDNYLRAYSVVGAGNQAPGALNQTVTCVEDEPVTIVLSGNDANGDPLSALVTSLPAKGTLFQTSDGVQVGQPITVVPALVKNPQRKLIYRPAPDGFGTPYTSFGFKVNDGSVNSASATVTVNVSNVNDAPLAVDDRTYLRAGNLLESYWPTANDIDADGESLQIVSFTQPSHGSVTQNADGSLRYVPEANFNEGTDTFQYTLRDGGGLTASASVEVVISEAFGREWPTFGNGPDHTGRYPGSLGLQPLVERWKFATGAAINPLAVADGKVFFTVTGNWNNYMHAVALDAATGSEAWRTQFQPGNSLNPPTFYKGVIYLQRGNHSSDTQLWALNAGDGSIKWQAAHGAQWERYIAPAVSDLGVYINGGGYGGIYGFNKDTGSQKFFLGLEQYDQWTPSIYEGGVYSFVMGKFRSHDPASGAVLWTLDLGWDWSGYSMYRTVAFDSGRAYLTNNKTGGNELVCIDLVTRSVLWRVQAQFTGTPAVMGGIVYALSGGTVKTYGASAGQWLGDFVAPGEYSLTGSPLITGDLVFATSSSKTYLFNRATRQLLQTLAFSGQPVVADDVVYFACSDNSVRAYGRVNPDNHAPITKAVRAGIVEEAAVALRLEATDPDGDALRFVIRSLPSQGTLYQTTDGSTKGVPITQVPALVQNGQGIVIYQAPLNVSGTAAGLFTFTAHDVYSASAPESVQIDIAPINDPPVAVPDSVALRPGQVLSNFHPESNDRDPDGDVLSVVAFTQGNSGQVTQSADGSLQYAPIAGFTSGTDTFTYTIRDAAGVEATASVSITVSATLGRDWPTFGAGPEHTGYVPLVLGNHQFTQRWSNNLGKPAHQLAVAGGRVFASFKVYHQDSSLVALDSSAGGELWRVNFTGGAYMNPPSAFGSDVFMQYSNSSSSRLHAMSAANGAARWSSPFSAQWEEYFAPAIDATGVYVNGGTYGGIYGFNVTSGAQLFFQSLEQYDQWTPVLHNGGLYSFVMGRFRSHHKTTGATLWNLDFGWDWHGYDINRTIACADNRAFVVNDSVTIPAGDQELIAVDLSAQSIAWKVRGKFTGTPAVAHQAVFAISGGNSVRAYDSATGAYLGAYVAPNETALWWQPIVTNDALITFSNTKTYIFDLQTRQLRQTLNFGGYASLAGESLYIASGDNFVRAFGVPDPTNRPPSAQPLTRTTAEDTDLTITLQGQDADNDPLSFVITRLPAAGVLYQTADGTTRGAAISATPALVTGSTPRVIYAPPADRNGAELGDFSYAASDGKGLSPEAAVALAITPVNDPPIAFADSRTIQPEQILSPIRETLNDFDVDGDTLHVVAFTQPPKGRVEQNSDGTLRYHPPKNATNGVEQFTYTIEDAAGARSTATVSVSIASVINGFWPTLGNGPDHTGYVPATLGRTGWVQRWSYQSGSGVNQVAIAEGKVFVSANGGTPSVAALAEKSGEQLWKRTFPSAFSMNPPSYHAGKVYVQRGNHSSDTQLIALQADDGKVAWSSAHSAQWENYLAPAISDMGVFINGGTYGGMYGFNRSTGSQLFFRGLAQTDRWTPALLGNELFSFVNGTLTKHDPVSGNTVWSQSFGWGGFGYSMNRTVTLQGRFAYLVNDSPSATYNDEDLVCVNLDTRSAVWSVNGDFTGTPAVNNGVLYVLSANTVQARSTSDGRLLGSFTAPAGEFLTGQPIITDDLVIAGAGQKTYLFGRYDYALVQTLNRGGSASVGDDQVIIAGTDGTVAAYAAQPAVTFSPAGGAFEDPVDVILSAAEPGGRIYYTVDGSAPDFSSASVTSGQTVRVNWTGKIRAILVKGSAVSRINEASYTMLDSDIDGLPDWWEKSRFGGISVTSSSRDSDGDGVSDGLEFIAGTDPLDATDFFGIMKSARSQLVGNQIEISWESKSDRIYILECSTDLSAWEAVSTPILGDGQIKTQYQTITGAQSFYRVRVMPRVQEVNP